MKIEIWFSLVCLIIASVFEWWNSALLATVQRFLFPVDRPGV